MADSKCWELKANCMMREQAREEASCPAYRQGLGCWEVDWKEIVSSLPASQQEYWFFFMEKCPSCVAYKAHPDEMQARIEEVSSLRLDD